MIEGIGSELGSWQERTGAPATGASGAPPSWWLQSTILHHGGTHHSALVPHSALPHCTGRVPPPALSPGEGKEPRPKVNSAPTEAFHLIPRGSTLHARFFWVVGHQGEPLRDVVTYFFRDLVRNGATLPHSPPL